MYLKLYAIAIIFSFKLLKDSSAIHGKPIFKFQEKLFALNSRRHRTWQHIIGKPRRDLDIHLSGIPSRERGPSRDPKGYNPVYGFEPYWEFGDWVFDKIRAKKGEIKMCGHNCPELYKKIGRICAVNKVFAMRNYESYCELRDQDCEGIEGWTAVYRGTCLGVSLPVPTDPDVLASRADNYIYEFNKISPTTTSTVRTTRAG